MQLGGNLSTKATGRHTYPWFFALIFPLLLFSTNTFSTEGTLKLTQLSQESLGLYARSHVEATDVLSWQDAYQQSKTQFKKQTSAAPNFGIGAKPFWLALDIDNDSAEIQKRILLIDTSWLDKVSVFAVHDESGLFFQQSRGDAQAFRDRPTAITGFTFELNMPSGSSTLLIRIETDDPAVVPLHLFNPETLNQFLLTRYYTYGFGYGFLIALIFYNAFLYFGLRDERHLHYAIYLACFTLANISYTGHGYMWFWSDYPWIQRWAQPTLMILFASAGLSFALKFLNIRQYSHAIYKFVVGFTLATSGLLTLCILFNQQTGALLTAFFFAVLYSILMVFLGLFSLVRGETSAQYFLLAVLAGAVGIATTALSAWGLIPFNSITFRAAEIGMLIEATLLALALAARVREAELAELEALQLANTDSLTGLNNRRSFELKIQLLWEIVLRHNRPASIIVLDIDDFKSINDNHGHAIGDLAIAQVGVALKHLARHCDVVARWGGEEFIIFMPETQAKDAKVFAERLRLAIEKVQVIAANHEPIALTASFGICQKCTEVKDIATLIQCADQAMYKAKALGKNQVVLVD